MDDPPSPTPRVTRTLLELVTIIVGVLIALAVDSWAAGRTDRELERHYLESMARDLRSDSATFARLFLPAMAEKEQALRTIAPVVRGGPLRGDTLEFLRMVGLGGRLGSTAPVNLTLATTHDELVATGHLALIRSPALRGAIVEHYYRMRIQTDRLRARIADYPMYVHRYVPAELRGLETEAEMRAFGLARAVRGFRSPEFEALMNQELNFLFLARSVFEEGAVETQAMLRLVDAERARLGASREAPP